MRRIIAYLIPVLVAISPVTSATEKAWHPVESGCYQQSVLDSVAAWRDAPYSSSSLRIAVVPDSGRGPATVVALDKGINRELGANNEPVLIAAVGDGLRTCVHRMPISACEPAQRVRTELSSIEIPLARDLDAGFSIRLHATQYHLQWRDGSANANAVSYVDPEHPVARAVTEAMASLDSCLAPARDAWRHGR